MFEITCRLQRCREVHKRTALMLRINVKILGNLDTKEGMEAYPIIKSMIPWSEKLYDMTDEQIAEYKSAFIEEYHNSEEKKEREVIDVMYIEYQYFQLRKDYNWVIEQFKLSGDKMAIRREILLQRLRGSNASPLDPEDIEYLIANMKKSTRDIIINNKWRFLLYDHGQGLGFNRELKDLDENIPYIVGIDPSSGGGGDNFAVTIINPYNLKIAAEFKSPYMGGTAACKMLVTLVTEYIPKACLVIERNSMGIYLIQMIVDQTSIAQNLYWNKSQKELEDAVTDDPSTDELKKLSQIYRKYGTYTSNKVRNAMFELLFKHVTENKDLLLSEYLVNDICKLVRTSTGKIEALKGEHDDNLMSYLHAIYIYYTGDNLDAFGIIRSLEAVQENLDDILDTQNNFGLGTAGGFFSTAKSKKTYEDLVVEDAMRVEEETKLLVDTFDFIHDDVYSRRKLENQLNGYDETVELSSYFFDTLNNTF